MTQRLTAAVCVARAHQVSFEYIFSVRLQSLDAYITARNDNKMLTYAHVHMSVLGE